MEVTLFGSLSLLAFTLACSLIVSGEVRLLRNRQGGQALMLCGGYLLGLVLCGTEGIRLCSSIDLPSRRDFLDLGVFGLLMGGLSGLFLEDDASGDRRG